MLDQRQCLGKGGTEAVELGVDGDPQRLEGARRGVRRGVTHPGGNGAGHRRGQLQRRGRTGADHRGGDPAGETFLAIEPKNAAELGDVGGRDELGGGGPRGGVHPHVKGGVGAEREASLGAVELHRRDTQVVQHGRDRTHLGGDGRDVLGELVVRGVDEVDAVAVGGEPPASEVQRIRVTVEADEVHGVRAGTQQGRGVARSTDRGVHDDRGTGRRQRAAR